MPLRLSLNRYVFSLRLSLIPERLSKNRAPDKLRPDGLVCSLNSRFDFIDVRTSSRLFSDWLLNPLKKIDECPNVCFEWIPKLIAQCRRIAKLSRCMLTALFGKIALIFGVVFFMRI